MFIKGIHVDHIGTNVSTAISDLMIDIAHENDDFVCEKCLDTLGTLGEVLTVIDPELAKETLKEVRKILRG